MIKGKRIVLMGILISSALILGACRGNSKDNTTVTIDNSSESISITESGTNEGLILNSESSTEESKESVWKDSAVNVEELLDNTIFDTKKNVESVGTSVSIESSDSEQDKQETGGETDAPVPESSESIDNNTLLELDVVR